MFKGKLPTESQLLFYRTTEGHQRIEVRLEQGTVWLSQRHMAGLFQTTTANVNIHLKNIFSKKELDESSVIKESLILGDLIMILQVLL